MNDTACSGVSLQAELKIHQGGVRQQRPGKAPPLM